METNTHTEGPQGLRVRNTYSVTRETRGLPYDTLPPEHIFSTHSSIDAVCYLHEQGCRVYDTTVGYVQRLNVGENITAQNNESRYSIERES